MKNTSVSKEISSKNLVSYNHLKNFLMEVIKNHLKLSVIKNQESIISLHDHKGKDG